MSDPYWKQLFIVCLYLVGVALLIWWSVDLSESFVKSDITNYINENGTEPTREIAEKLRAKSVYKRAATSGLVVFICNYVFFKFIYKPKPK